MSSADTALQTMIANLAKNTGKSLAQWVALARTLGTKHGEIVKALKAGHGLGHGYANLIAQETLSGAVTATEPIYDADALFAGAKAPLRPIYAALLKAAQQLGADVEVAPKKANVVLRRKKNFALLQPSTANRFDLGLNLKGEAAGPRLEASGSFSAMCTHRVRISSASEVDVELLGWLQAAYERAG